MDEVAQFQSVSTVGSQTLAPTVGTDRVPLSNEILKVAGESPVLDLFFGRLAA